MSKTKEEVLEKALIDLDAFIQGKFGRKFGHVIEGIVRYAYNAGAESNGGSYEDGLKDAWKIAKKITLDKKDGGLSIDEMTATFGFINPYNVFDVYEIDEVMEKLKVLDEKEEYKSCDSCYYERFDAECYPCSLCIRGIERQDLWQKDEQ